MIDRSTELTVYLVNALIATEIEQRQLLDNGIFFVGGHGLEIVDLFLLVPQQTIGFGELREHFAQCALDSSHGVALTFKNFVGRESQTFQRNIPTQSGGDKFVYFALQLRLLRAQTFQTRGILRVELFEFDNRQFVAQRTESFSDVAPRKRENRKELDS